MGVVQGTDVSVLQGTVPYAALKKIGHAFSFIRCKVGNNPGVDARFVENVRRARGEGLFPGPYFFPFPLPHLDPKVQAKAFLAAALVDGEPVGSMRGDLPPAFDLEWPPPHEWGKWKCTADQIVDWSLECLAEIRLAYGIAPVIYSYPYFLQSIAKARDFPALMTYQLWIAGGGQYENGNAGTPRRDENGVWLDKPPLVAGWGGNWMFWQHDGNGGQKLPGGADSDFNVYRFDLADLERLVQVLDDGPAPSFVPDMATIIAMRANVMAEDVIHEYRQERIARMFADVA